MAYVSSFVYCDSIREEMTPDGPRNQIVSPLQMLTPIAIPGNYSFAVSCNIFDLQDKDENTIEVSFITPMGKCIYDTGIVPFSLPKDNNVAKINSMQFNVDIRNLILPEEGLYTTNVLIDGKLVGEYRIKVVKGIYNE